MNRSKNILIIIICLALIAAVIVEKNLNKKEKEEKKNIKELVLSYFDSNDIYEENYNKEEKSTEAAENKETSKIKKIEIKNIEILNFDEKTKESIINYINSFISEKYPYDDNIIIIIHDNIEIDNEKINFSINVDNKEKVEYYYITLENHKFDNEKIDID